MNVVLWSMAAHEEIIRLVDANQHYSQRIQEAIRELIRTLMDDPSGVGESRQGSSRIGFFDPLVSFEYDASQRIVEIKSVILNPKAA